MTKRDKEMLLAKLAVLNTSVSDPVLNTLIGLIMEIVSTTDQKQELGFTNNEHKRT